MTGFAAATGLAHGYSWAWEIRSVNAKGLDLRLRVPDWISGLEADLRAPRSTSSGRGSVSLAWRVSRDDEVSALSVNQQQLTAVLEAMMQVETQAMDRGLSLAPSKSSDIIAMRGVLDTSSVQTDTAPLRQTLVGEIAALIIAFNDMRQAEGASLHKLLDDQINTIQSLTEQAATLAEARKDDVASTLKSNLAKILQNSEGVDENRVAQELAILAVKSDVTEEIDRLHAHIGAARDLIATEGPIGRKLDFLMQEFNRETNTLCSKAQNVELTRVGLDLKAVIDQMREQVQNVE
jgi:uncharacterized protein (TIGR00255 family)